ncbi:hypothetical protein RDWZM_010298 [Blomia tropicalis]|uniref:Uncharacterized protein n=1 Tax=Blomia tropicalis TaxID=40697 RepID=A0A9Q0RHK2_BLOTA|nr:hypothetical protein BLOT_014671 [Blomia tropicalis]KAJ6215798.1 hypothetical protein RDWZM_010298 [Blomia tropicalis]
MDSISSEPNVDTGRQFHHFKLAFLIPFSGTVKDFPRFWCQFSTIVDHTNATDAEKLSALRENIPLDIKEKFFDNTSPHQYEEAKSKFLNYFMFNQCCVENIDKCPNSAIDSEKFYDLEDSNKVMKTEFDLYQKLKNEIFDMEERLFRTCITGKRIDDDVIHFFVYRIEIFMWCLQKSMDDECRFKFERIKNYSQYMIQSAKQKKSMKWPNLSCF